MSNLLICRLCLVSDVKMYGIENTQLEVIYENMCSNKLQTEDGRPTLACYLCYTQLKKCHRLKLKAMKSDTLLTQILNTGIQLTRSSINMIDRQHYKLTESLRRSSVEFTNVMDKEGEQEVFINEVMVIKHEVPVEFQNNIDRTEGECTETSDTYVEELEEDNDDSVVVQAASCLEICLETDGDEMTSSTQHQTKESVEKAKPLRYFDLPYKCGKCYRGFEDSAAYKEHKEQHNKDIGKPYSCPLCDYKFSYNGHLKAHMRTHTGEKPYSCTMCEYRCAKNANVTAHMRKHTGEKPFSCTLCEYKCAKNANLKAHMRKHTGEKPFHCTICVYRCAKSTNLKAHMRKHTGEKPYSCTLCEYRCSHSGDIKKHMLKHTGEMAYSCTVCEYKCSHNANLKAHMRKHTGEKPYACKLCDYKSTQNSHLKVHMRKHVDENPYSATIFQLTS